jgi:hypothetical protein
MQTRTTKERITCHDVTWHHGDGWLVVSVVVLSGGIRRVDLPPNCPSA